MLLHLKQPYTKQRGLSLKRTREGVSEVSCQQPSQQPTEGERRGGRERGREVARQGEEGRVREAGLGGERDRRAAQ